MGYYVPDTLKTRQNWLVWRFEDTGNRKLAKVPYSPKTGTKASVTNAKHWATYNDAVNYFQYGGNFDGIGFVFTEADNLVFIDLDECITENGEETPLAAELQELFKDTYIELSQSERGLHIICKGVIPRAFKQKEIEVYTKGRYMAFTGNAINTVEPTAQQTALNALFSKYAPKETQEPQQQKIASKTADFEAVINSIKASKQAVLFEDLSNGEWDKYKHYPSQSEADQAFINIINFFTGGNDNLTKQIWNASEPSKRPKGKRPDYIKAMIENAKKTANQGNIGGYTRTRIKTAEIDTNPVKSKRRIRK